MFFGLRKVAVKREIQIWFLEGCVLVLLNAIINMSTHSYSLRKRESPVNSPSPKRGYNKNQIKNSNISI
jgi:hypothetical protein